MTVLEILSTTNKLDEISFKDLIQMQPEMEQRKAELPKTEAQLEALSNDQIRALIDEADMIKRYEETKAKAIEQRQALIDATLQGKGMVIEQMDEHPQKDKQNMTENLELRALQKYVTAGYKNMSETEQRALNVLGSAVVIPTNVMNRLITDEKYSTLLSMATVFNEPKAGKISIPIASNTSASWKIENSDVDGDDASYEATPSLTNIELGGYELYRWARISAAAHSLSSEGFEQMLLQVLGSEVIEALEAAFVKGSGSAQPKGLDNLTWVADSNLIEATTAIAPADIAKAISLLKAKYARNAIVMMNTATYADVALFKGTTEFAYDLSSAAEKFLGHKIVINEHVADDVIYIVDPAELYVRFSMPLQLDVDASSSFTKASVDLRCLTVVDAAFNPKACVKVAIKSGL